MFDALQRAWWRPERGMVSIVMRPLSWLYSGLLALRPRAVQAVPVPVVVVGNLVVGGAGKTPTVIALVQALRRAGRRPGVVSRGHGALQPVPRAVTETSMAAEVGDEPLLIQRRAAAPVWVGRRRAAAARALCTAHPEVDVIVSDDGLQHRALPRVAEVVVFDARGVGNGCLLPAGPLREPMPQRPTSRQRVLYNADAPSTAWPGELAQRAVHQALPLQAWARGEHEAAVPLSRWRGQTLHACAGIAEPQRFFAMLESAGLRLQRWPMPDHDRFERLPWPDQAADVLVTEKDAVKLIDRGEAFGTTRLWVVPLDFTLPAPLVRWVLDRLAATAP